MSNNQQNTFVTSVAVLLVVVTLYFTTNALKRNYESNQLKIDELNRLREYEKQQQDLLRQELELKEIKRQADISAKFKEHQDCCYDLQIFTSEILSKDKSIQQILNENIEKSSEILQNKFNKKTLYRKKDLNKTPPPKKGASTEPIIYLFVLVLLYLLLKAASDITQHYKEQSKGDKRNTRRCSLQVYAQMKNDRRPSKGTNFKNIFNYFKS